jgi:hypothetical protein
MRVGGDAKRSLRMDDNPIATQNRGRSRD